MFLLDEILIKSRLRLLEEVEWFSCFPASPIVDPRQEYARLHRHCLLFFIHPDFFHNRFVPWKGFQREFPRHPCDQQTASSASRETRVISNYCIKRKASREKVWAWPSQRDLSVCDQESCCNCLSETSCQSVHDLLLFPSLMNPR